MYKLISITQWGKEIKLDTLDIIYVGKDSVLARYKGFGWLVSFNPANCYEVKTEKI